MDDLTRLRVETRLPADRGGDRAAAGGGAVAAVAAPASPLGAPSAADGQSARFPASKTKLDNLFLQWLSLPESQKLVLHLLDDARAGRPLASPAPPTPGAAASPMSPSTAAALFATPPPLSPLKGKSPRSPSSPRRTPLGTPLAAAAAAAAAAGGLAGTAAIPRFFHGPGGPPPPPAVLSARAAALDALLAGAGPAGLALPAVKDVVRDVFDLPPVLAYPLFSRLVPTPAGDAPATTVPAAALRAWIDGHGGLASPPPRRMFDILAGEPGAGGDAADGGRAVTAEGLKALVAGVLLSHPGLEFLQETPEFQDRYAETVIHRMLYAMDRGGGGRLRAADLKRGGLLPALRALDADDDVNRVTAYFSYEHFYVIYCKFWELDTDHDFLLSKDDVLRYGNHALTYRIVDRVFAQAARPFASGVDGRMCYEDFVWFVLSEEDKTTDAALAYWFRALDLDGDGALTPPEMAYFYEEQLHRMECLSQEPVQFTDVLTQVTDMISPAAGAAAFTLADLRRARGVAGTLFNMLFNLNKFVAFETRDPFLVRQEREGDGTDGGAGAGALDGVRGGVAGCGEWQRFARAEYVRLAMEEEGGGGGGGGEGWEQSLESPF